jgi:methyltransferase-like protein/2-polyprenyl-3-methyl-5-hydroxy-6-metoxy-1,4-benzoquinol methylase
MSAVAATTYDEMPYESYPFPQSHPDRLATVATLLSLQVPPVERCRVLELGCAAGGNLIPMALGLPQASFVGIDLSARQIADGQAMVQALGLTNVTLEQRSILDVPADWGPFDYIVCHGVYSWVPPPVQDKILDVCRQNLVPEGVAYVSYNTYPGWHLRSMIRRMMLYHASHFTEPQRRVQQARALLDFLVESAGQESTPYGAILKSELEVVRNSRDNYLFHDHLEENNEPVYFYEFIERATAKGLQYLGEADVMVMVPANFQPKVQEVLRRLAPDTMHMEQYMDFLRNRMFRQTLLCHQGRTPTYGVRPDRLTAFHVASPVRPASAVPDLHSTGPEQFCGLSDISMTVNHPLVKAALLHLGQVWPRAVPFEQLRETARTLLGWGPSPLESSRAEDNQCLGESLLKAYTTVADRLVELHVCPARPVPEVSTRPVASPLARLQAAQGQQVTTLRHQPLWLAEFDRQLVRLLDGSRDRAALLDALAELVRQDVLVIHHGGERVTDDANIRRYLSAALEQQLPFLARQALLVG